MFLGKTRVHMGIHLDKRPIRVGKGGGEGGETLIPSCYMSETGLHPLAFELDRGKARHHSKTYMASYVLFTPFSSIDLRAE